MDELVLWYERKLRIYLGSIGGWLDIHASTVSAGAIASSAGANLVESSCETPGRRSTASAAVA